MNKVIACIDGAPHTASVCDYAVWLARRLAKPLVFLHAREQFAESGSALNLGGSVAASAAAGLLDRIAALDKERDQLAGEHGMLLLEEAATQARTSGLNEVGTLQCPGGLQDALVALESDTRMLVMGRRYDGTDSAGISLPWDHSVERAVRGLSHPVFVATARYREPAQFMIAFDGSPTSQRIIDAVISSPVLQDLPAHLVTVTSGPVDAQTEHVAAQAAHMLGANGRAVHTHFLTGDAETALPDFARTMAMDLLIMGAYGHSRIRQFIVGSVTTTLLRTSPVPVVVLR